LSEKETRIAKARVERPVPTLEQIHHVLRSMPADTDLELRNRALVAFTLLTGARDGAIASMKLKHVDVAKGAVMQDAREVHTKFSKTFTFFPVGDEVGQIVIDWVGFLTNEKLFGPTDPLFPATQVVLGGEERRFQAGGLSRLHWSNATPIRAVFKAAFEGAGLPYANPHAFRKTLAQLGERLCQTPEEFKAWSQNLGHDQVLTTFSSYGNLTGARQAELIRSLTHRSRDSSTVDPIGQAMRLLEQARHQSL
jgi:integrase